MPRLPYFPRPLATVAPRDLLLLESLPIRPTDVALEVGTGSGSSMIRLAGAVAAMHGVDVAEAPIERLRRSLFGKHLREVRRHFRVVDALERILRRADAGKRAERSFVGLELPNRYAAIESHH